MRLKTVLKATHGFKGFVYVDVKWGHFNQKRCLEAVIRPRQGSRPVCSSCGRTGAVYDTPRAPRRFLHVPLWGIAFYLIYTMRRVDCRRCGVKIERVPWGEGKQEQTLACQWFLARWARRMSWKAVADAFGMKWHHVSSAVEMAVDWGRRHQDLDGVTAIGVDEIQWGSGHRYLTVVYQIDAGLRRLLWVGQSRKKETLEAFFDWFSDGRAQGLEFVCSDMWRPYLDVIRRRAGKALNILDRFHIVGYLNKAVDETRRKEAAELKRLGQDPVLTGSRWLLLKRPANLTPKQAPRLRELVRMNLRTVRAYMLKEHFQHFWTYKTAGWAGRFLADWCEQAMRSRLEPMKKVAEMLRRHRPLLLNYFRARKAFSSGVVEGLNNKAKTVTKRAYGYRSYKTLETALYHGLGNLPEPKLAHWFS